MPNHGENSISVNRYVVFQIRRPSSGTDIVVCHPEKRKNFSEPTMSDNKRPTKRP